jgi:hypothetical protein
VATLLQVHVALEELQVALHHLVHQGLQVVLVFPAEHALGLAGVAFQVVHFGRAVVARVDGHQGLAGLLVDALLLHALAFPLELDAHFGEGQVDEVAHGVGLAGGQHEVIGFLGLQHQPHAFHVSFFLYSQQFPNGKLFLSTPHGKAGLLFSLL